MKSSFLNPNNKMLRVPTDTLAIYNCHDTVNTARLVGVLEGVLEANNQLGFFREWFDGMVPVVDRMMDRGVGVLDQAARKAYKERLRAELRPLERKILDACPFWKRQRETLLGTIDAYRAEFPTRQKTADRKLASGMKKIKSARGKFFGRGGERNNSDLAKFLFDELGIKEPPATQKRPKRSVGQDALFYILQHFRVKDEPHRWLIEDLFHRSRLNTILTRYMTVDCEGDGRVHPTIKLYGAETLRLAYAGDAGEAIQQWPKEARHIIRAAEGHTYVNLDYSQLEARILAVLANDTGMLEAFERGDDVHTVNAIDLFGEVPLDARGRAPEATRNFCKTFLYGLSYGGQPETMNTKLYCPCPRCAANVPPTLKLTRDEIRRAADRWAKKHQPVLKWRSALLESIKGPRGDHSWTSPFGYRRFFFQPRSDAERSIYNCPMQHCGSMIVNRAMVAADAAGLPLVLQHHDSLMTEPKTEETEKCAALMKEIMEAPVPELGGARFPTDLKVGPTWGDV